MGRSCRQDTVPGLPPAGMPADVLLAAVALFLSGKGGAFFLNAPRTALQLLKG